jgi:hypothetical protein
MNQLTPCKVEWLWPGRLALGHLALFDGDPGLGKSLITIDICARITTGRQWPDGTPGGAPASVVIVNAEDEGRNTIYHRLYAAGADINRVVVWQREPGEPWLRLPDHADQLDRIIKATGAVYVVLDPFFAFLDSRVQAASDPDVRRALAPLADVARRHGCVIQLIRHLNKLAGGSALYRGAYSIAFMAACRLAWLAGPDPRLPSQFLLAQLKNNLDAPQPSLGYSIRGHESGAGRIEWHGASPWRDDDLVVRLGKRMRNKQRVHEFLLGMLKEGPRTVREIWAAADPLGLPPRALRDARKPLGIRTIRIDPFKPEQQSWWLLPGQELPGELRDCDAAVWEREMRELESRQPQQTPLDDDHDRW